MPLAGSFVSQCKNRIVSPSAKAAPAFIWRARPGSDSTSRARPSATAQRVVRAAPVGEDDLLLPRLGVEHVEHGGQARRFVQYGHDDGDHRGILLWNLSFTPKR